MQEPFPELTDLELKAIDQACVLFHENFVTLRLSPQDATVDPTMLVLQISCSRVDWQLSSLE